MSETTEQELTITYLAPIGPDGEAVEFPYTVGWRDSLTFIKQMVTGFMMPDPTTRERCVWDHGEIRLEDGSRIYFHWNADERRLVWEEEEQPPTDVQCPECSGRGLYVAGGRVVHCSLCSGTGRVIA
jgi:hypothetical protein